jgi:hypothetical protein
MNLRSTIQNALPSGLFLATFLFTLPLVAAAQGKIAFESLRDVNPGTVGNNREIYVMNPDGSNQTNRPTMRRVMLSRHLAVTAVRLRSFPTATATTKFT